MKKIYLLILATSLAIGNICIAQPVTAELDSMLARTLDSMQKRTGIKSASAAIQVSANDVWAKASGISSINPTVYATHADAYLIGSVTKTITSACILQLADENKLSLDDSIGKWLPSYKYVNPAITIRQLLRHQSGLADVLSHPDCQGAMLSNIDSVWQTENIIRDFLNPPLDTAGSAWNYCNTNYMLLGLVIKRITGHPFYEEIRNRFFTQLGMFSFTIPSFEARKLQVAHVWMDLDGDKITEDGNDFYMAYKSLNSTAGAAGGYFATARDVSKWMWTYMRGDLLSAAMMAEAKTTVPASGAPGGQYGLGLKKNRMAGLLCYGHGGDLAYSATSWYFPDKDISISVLGNDADRNSWQLLPIVEALLKTYIKWQTTIGINAVEKSDVNVSIYPTPFQNELNISVTHNAPSKEMQVRLLGATGQQLACTTGKKVNNKETQFKLADLSQLTGGMYYVQVYADDVCIHSAQITK